MIEAEDSALEGGAGGAKRAYGWEHWNRGQGTQEVRSWACMLEQVCKLEEIVCASVAMLSSGPRRCNCSYTNLVQPAETKTSAHCGSGTFANVQAGRLSRVGRESLSCRVHSVLRLHRLRIAITVVTTEPNLLMSIHPGRGRTRNHSAPKVGSKVEIRP